MGSPVNLGDAIALLTSIYNIYDDYRNIPDRLRNILKQFGDVEKECEALNRVLATSRRQEYQMWPGTDRLVSDLETAHEYFKRYRPLTDVTGEVRMSRIKQTLMAKWNWGTVDNHIAKIESHRENMKDFKQTVLIQAAQDNIELQLHAIRLHLNNRQDSLEPLQITKLDDTSSLASDHMSVLSRASRSLGVARQLRIQPAKRENLQLSPIIEASSASARSDLNPQDDLKQKVAEIIERNELHIRDNLPTTRIHDLESIAELPDRWYRAQMKREKKELRAPGPFNTTVQSNSTIDLPVFTRDEIHMEQPRILEVESDAHSITASWRRALDAVGYENDRTTLSSADEYLPPKPTPEVDDLTISETSSEASTDSDETITCIENGVKVIEPWSLQQFPCRLRFLQSEGSLCVQASTIKRYTLGAMPSLGGRTPSHSVLGGEDHHNETHYVGTVPLIFNHAVRGGLSSFPKVLHPSAEISAGSTDHPYAIEFYEHQYVQAKGYPKLSPAVRGFGYLFKNKRDRDLAREKIFGRQLRVSAGIMNIQFDRAPKGFPRPCNTQATSLWTLLHENTDLNLSPDSLTITIQCSAQGRSEPDCVVECVVLKVSRENIRDVRKGSVKELKLELRPLPKEHHDVESEVSTISGVLSSNSTATNISASSGHSSSPSEAPMSPKLESRRTSFLSRRRTSSISTVIKQPLTSFKCYIRFTETSTVLKAKEEFLKVLEQHFS